jgi:hypothetical protein
VSVALQIVGDWDREMKVPLGNALAASVELTGKSGRAACEHAMVLMAQSASSMTEMAKKNRKVQSAGKGVKYVVKQYQNGKAHRIYRGMPKPHRTSQKIIEGDFTEEKAWAVKDGVWPMAKRIHEQGLARRSWFWGLSGLSTSTQKNKGGKKIPSVTTMAQFLSDTKCGLILTNRLGYINKVTPPNIEQQAAAKATNRIMATAARAVERKFGIRSERLAKEKRQRMQKKLSRIFKESNR